MSPIEKLQSKITNENLQLLDENERDSEYALAKMSAWQGEECFDWVEWEDFNENWFYCRNCYNYVEGQCICYAR